MTCKLPWKVQATSSVFASPRKKDVHGSCGRKPGSLAKRPLGWSAPFTKLCKRSEPMVPQIAGLPSCPKGHYVMLLY